MFTTLGSLGEDRAPASSARSDVSAPPAGIDSPASVSRVSQTSRTFDPSGFEGRILGGPAQRPMQAGFGLAAPLTGLIGGAARTLARPGVGGALTGFGTGMAAEFITDMFGNTKKLVITRKLQRDVKKVFMMSGGDVGFISMNSLMLFGKDLSQDQILMILFKTFKNQGPYVTKAAVRKTRQTIRKLDTLEQLKAQMCPPRRAPARRRTMGSTTKVLQVK